MRNNLLLCLVGVVCLSSCTVLPQYIEPAVGLGDLSKSNLPKLAVISQNKIRKSFVNWSETSIKRIDGQLVGMTNTRLRVKPGKHVLVVEVRFHNKFGDGPRVSLPIIKADLKEKMNYRVMFSTTKDQIVKAWLENSATHKVVSSIGEAVSTREVESMLLTPMPYLYLK